MSNVFGSCVDLHATWEEGVDELGRATVTFSSNVEDQEPVTICIDPLKGAMIDGGPVEVVDGVLQLPTDLFGAGELSTDGETYTITFPGQEPQPLCVNPVKDVVDAEGNSLVADGVATLPEGSTTVPEPEGFHTITTDDGVATEVCLDPLKDVVDAEGNSLVTDAVATLPVGSTTVPEGDSHIIATDDAVATRVCVNQFKGIRDNGDGTYTVEVMGQDGILADGDIIATIPDTDQRLTNPAITQETANGVTTHTVTWDIIDIEGNVVGQESASGIPLPTFVDKAGNVLAGPVTVMQQADFVLGEYAEGDVMFGQDAEGNCKATPITPAVTSGFTSNGDGTTTHDDGNGNTTENIQEDIVDGGSNLVADDGVTINPILDCNSAPVDVAAERFMLYSQMADLGVIQSIKFVDSGDGCTPADPDAKLVEVFGSLETKNPFGYTYQFNTIVADAWECCEPKTVEPVCVIEPIRTWLEDELSALPAGPHLTTPPITITNDTCYPMLVTWEARTSMFYQLRNTWRVSADWGTGAGSDLNLSDQCTEGNIGTLFGVPSNAAGWSRIRSSGLTRTLTGKLAPGESSAYSIDLEINVNTVGEVNANNLLTVGSTTVRGRAELCKR